ncbi:GNAT family N-acetyltransferase [Arthrobacter sp. MA-N2]|uniref:GNAT family N-acetyltransferase n=1 Tax=Arthrobacter sp. MA-N2 TaxID=1101188 RepID=UPI0004B7FD1E|nr:GNAT family N-acetyltransferase [Arthrobacter sp. MA-N2]
MSHANPGLKPLLSMVLDEGVFTLRRAHWEDLPAILRLLAADQLGSSRENAEDIGPYLQAFQQINEDPAQLLVVGHLNGSCVATFQLSFIPGLARKGSLRCQIEAVRVAAELRDQGVGAAMMQWAIEEARRRGCTLVQLTSDKSRKDAHRFYERLGFVASHEGMKLAL